MNSESKRLECVDVLADTAGHLHVVCPAQADRREGASIASKPRSDHRLVIAEARHVHAHDGRLAKLLGHHEGRRYAKITRN